MAQIQPITTWFKGNEHQANIFNLYSTGDNLIDAATFQYQLVEEVTVNNEQNSQTLITGELSIVGQEYNQWDSSISANEWIYNWAANKLNLQIISI